MDIRALVLINAKDDAAEGQVPLTGPPWALLDVAGMSPLERTAEHLERYGILPATAVIETYPFYQPGRAAASARIDLRPATSDHFWQTSESVFRELVQNGAELVVVIRLGAYAEIDFEKLLQFHLGQSCRVSQVVHERHAPDVFCLSASRRNDAGLLFRTGLSKCRCNCPGFLHAGYVNPLADARDFRQLAVDVLTLRTTTRPAGREVRPGVWIAPKAVVEKGSRILAPAFIGSSARVRAGALVTRCTAIEHHAHVDCGTVVENSTVLPHSYIGAGLDLTHSVAGMGQIANLRRSATLEVVDPKLLGHVACGAGERLLSGAGGILSSISRSMRGLFAERDGRQVELRPALRKRSSGLGEDEAVRQTNASGEFSSPLAVARRYGDQ